MAAAQAAEDRFFTALRAGDTTELGELLTEDFAIVDVLSGAVADRSAFLAAFRHGSLKFTRVELVERSTRLHGDVAIIIGRTAMAGAYDGTGFTVSSRYTHVLVLGQDDRWRLWSAQGTKIIDAWGGT